MDKLILFLIKFYQLYISPRKGYCCAYGALYGNGSCSEQVVRIIRSQGLIQGWPLIKNQFVFCHQAYDIIKDKKKKRKEKDKNSWCDCSPCEVLNCIPNPGNLCKGKSIDGGCDLPCDCSL